MIKNMECKRKGCKFYDPYASRYCSSSCSAEDNPKKEPDTCGDCRYISNVMPHYCDCEKSLFYGLMLMTFRPACNVFDYALEDGSKDDEPAVDTDKHLASLPVKKSKTTSKILAKEKKGAAKELVSLPVRKAREVIRFNRDVEMMLYAKEMARGTKGKLTIYNLLSNRIWNLDGARRRAAEQKPIPTEIVVEERLNELRNIAGAKDVMAKILRDWPLSDRQEEVLRYIIENGKLLIEGEVRQVFLRIMDIRAAFNLNHKRVVAILNDLQNLTYIYPYKPGKSNQFGRGIAIEIAENGRWFIAMNNYRGTSAVAGDAQASIMVEDSPVGHINSAGEIVKVPTQPRIQTSIVSQTVLENLRHTSGAKTIYNAVLLNHPLSDLEETMLKYIIENGHHRNEYAGRDVWIRMNDIQRDLKLHYGSIKKLLLSLVKKTYIYPFRKAHHRIYGQGTIFEITSNTLWYIAMNNYFSHWR